MKLLMSRPKTQTKIIDNSIKLTYNINNRRTRSLSSPPGEDVTAFQLHSARAILWRSETECFIFCKQKLSL